MRTVKMKQPMKRMIGLALASMLVAGAVFAHGTWTFAEDAMVTSYGDVTWDGEMITYYPTDGGMATSVNASAETTYMIRHSSTTADPDNQLWIKNTAIGGLQGVMFQDVPGQSTIINDSTSGVSVGVLTEYSFNELRNTGKLTVTTFENSGYVTNNGEIVCENSYTGDSTSDIYNQGDLDFSAIVMTNNGRIQNTSGATMTAQSYSGSGTLQNDGGTADAPGVTFTTQGILGAGQNDGYITGRKLTIKSGFTNNGTIRATGTNATVLTFQGTSDGDDLGHYVVNGSGAKVTSSGGSFYLATSDGGTEKLISGTFTDVLVADLMREPIITPGLMGKTNPISSDGGTYHLLKGTTATLYSTVQYGTAGQFTDSEPNLTYRYKSNSSDPWTELSASQAATFNLTGSLHSTTPLLIEATANPHAGYYYTSATAAMTVYVDYLARTNVTKVNGTDYVTVSGTPGVNGWYLSDVTLTPATGYQIKSSFAGKSTFANKLTLTQAECENTDAYYTLKRTSDGAETDAFWPSQLVTSTPLSSIKIDKEDPAAEGALDNESTTFALSDGMSVTGKKLNAVITDDNLATLIIDGESFGTSDFVDATAPVAGGGTRQYRLKSYEFTAVPGQPEHKIVATDEAGREIVIHFDLIYAKDDATAVVTVPDVTYGSKISPIVESSSNGRITYQFKPEDAGDDAYTSEVPTDVGTYSIRATIAATDKYKEVTAENKFSIVKATPALTATMGTAYIGSEFVPTLGGVPEGSEVTYRFRGANDTTGEWSTERPTVPGKYDVRATVCETNNYNPSSIDTTFTLAYLPVPATTYVVSGTTGENHYYTTDVYLTAPEGYEIASADGEFGAKLLYTEGMKSYRLRRADGARTDVIALNQAFKIDKDVPAAGSAVTQSGAAVALTNGGSVFADQLRFSIDDVNLTSVKVNGSDVEIRNGHADIILEPKGGIKTFAIEAKDVAGNTYSLTMTVKAAWRERLYIPTGMQVPLETGEAYNLEAGKWMVEGDDTIYNGGGRFYVRTNGDYTFTKAE